MSQSIVLQSRAVLIWSTITYFTLAKTMVWTPPRTLSVSARKLCSTASSFKSGIAANAFEIWDLASSTIIISSAVAIEASSPSGVGPCSSCCSLTPSQTQLSALLLSTFNIASEAIADVTSILLSAGTSLRADTSCGAAGGKMPAGPKCRDVRNACEHIDAIMRELGWFVRLGKE